MRKNLVVGILRETKHGEKRTPFTPSDANWLVKRGIKVEVESSPTRIFKDAEYKKAGANVVEKFKKASLLIGIKEPNPEDLKTDKTYMLFSHTIKGQRQNMPLLKACLKKNITLVDYEKITDLHGRRLVYFGRFAGICGLVDSLHCLGKKLEWKGMENPFTLIKQSNKYKSLKDLKDAMAKLDKAIHKKGFSKKLSPFIIGITGHGHVSSGVQEALDFLNPIEIHPKDMSRFIKHEKGNQKEIYKIVFLREEKFRAKNKKGFYFEEYLSKPENFESNLDAYLPYLNMLVHTSYWDRRYPRMITKEMIKKLSKRKIFRLEFIGDISCDVEGSIELTYKSTTPENPTFTYDISKKRFIDGYKSSGITILAVDNLPSELPRDASEEFSTLIKDYAYQIAAHGAHDLIDHVAIPHEIRKAVITQKGKLTKDYKYLAKCLK